MLVRVELLSRELHKCTQSWDFQALCDSLSLNAWCDSLSQCLMSAKESYHLLLQGRAPSVGHVWNCMDPDLMSVHFVISSFCGIAV